MDVSGPIPIHVARAYGLPAQASAAPAPNVAATPPDCKDCEPSAKSAGASGRVQDIVGAQVSRAVEFNSGATQATNPASYQLYTRAADKVEAAVAIQLGRSIDVTG